MVRWPQYGRRLGRLLAMESLEPRTVLNAAPTVVDLQVASTAWSPDFIGYLNSHGLGTVGYRVPVGSSVQSDTLPWKNINQIIIQFSEDVHVRASHLSVTTSEYLGIGVVDFFYDAVTHVATWTLARSLFGDNHLIDLDGDGIDPVKDLQGAALDGEWVNGADVYASGDGVAGGDFEFHINVLRGDVNQDRVTDIDDYLATYTRIGLTTQSNDYLPTADFDGSGSITWSDFSTVSANLWDSDLEGLPVGLFDDAPSASQIASVLIDDYIGETVIPLWDYFADAEDENWELDFAVKSVSNPGLFDYVEVDLLTGDLYVNAAWGASGRSEITISVTDSSGLVTETTFFIDVFYENQPPELFYWAEYEGYDTWTIRGYVVDADDDVRGMIVTFMGVFDMRATVQEDGTFSFAVIVDPEDWGQECGYVVDPHGAYSVIVYRDIFPT